MGERRRPTALPDTVRCYGYLSALENSSKVSWQSESIVRLESFPQVFPLLVECTGPLFIGPTTEHVSAQTVQSFILYPAVLPYIEPNESTD